MGDHAVDDQTVTVLHESVAKVAHLGLLPLALLIEPGIGVREGLMGRVFELLVVKIALLVAPDRRFGTAVLGLKALDRRPGFDQRAVHAEVLVRQQLRFAGLRDDPGQEQLGDIGFDQSLQIG